MIPLQKAIIAKLKKSGETFEVLVDCDKALEIKAGKNIPLDDVIASDVVYSDSKKGTHASENRLHDLFETEDNEKIIIEIIKKGDVQLTSEHKNKLRDEKEKQIIQIIHRNAINPSTNTPHPEDRIKNAMKEAKIKVDEFSSAEEQVQEIVKKLTPIIPIKYETRIIQFELNSKIAGPCMTQLKRFADIVKQDWQKDGSLSVQVKVPAGMQNELFEKLNSIAHGQIESKILTKL
jgi:ribosome maturation protein SDO1